MDREAFLEFVARADWRFAKSVPNWPHFYVVRREAADQGAFDAARQFIEDFGHDGKFFDIDVRYFAEAGWTYWSSPLAEALGSRYMLNRCKTEFTYESLAQAGALPVEGFRESTLSLAPVLEDPELRSLVREAEGGGFSVFSVLGTADYETRHSNVLAWLLDLKGSHGQGSRFPELLWGQLPEELELPDLTFGDYAVRREGSGELERIDLLVRAADNDWMIVIENKLFSPETGDQLARYSRYVEQRHAEVAHRIYLYLTPDGIAPAREEDGSTWKPVSYLTVKRAVELFLEGALPSRVRDFLTQYLEHVERNVLKSPGTIDKERSLLRRHAKLFHSLSFLLEEDAVRGQCSDAEFEVLKSILAVQHKVERELFEAAKRMVTSSGHRRHSGLAHWFTIELPGLREKLAQRGLLDPRDALPIVFVFDSRPSSFVVEMWLYKNRPLFSRLKGRISRLSDEGPEPSRGDEHLVAVLFRRTIIHADDIIKKSLSELKDMIAAYVGSELERDLEECVLGFVDQVDKLGDQPCTPLI